MKLCKCVIILNEGINAVVGAMEYDCFDDLDLYSLNKYTGELTYMLSVPLRKYRLKYVLTNEDRNLYELERR